MLSLVSSIFYILLFLPVWAFRRVFGVSRFERRFHARKSTWDSPVRFDT
ncbi:hypothetical protein C8N35_104241 [Breoghania corrubedonensis]|uniref:Uncharacterized protein n=1 Tax=Breoghania corrubedonensis TaxID=665038 RepID=A0A2T5VA36_9HYPH|nr:hypothetical protein C8N35_104241 [Breoghania corrubedonensis]